jgi:hypothetical protein
LHYCSISLNSDQEPTRYRVVVLTSPGPHPSQFGWANCISADRHDAIDFAVRLS